MDLQTQIPLKPQEHGQIDYGSKVFLLGSCFSENIGQKLRYFKFPASINPFGIQFHPKAIERIILRAVNEEPVSEASLIQQNQRWHCFDAHSSLSQATREALVDGLTMSSQESAQQVREATHLIITLGSAWAYRYLDTNELVSNCHKVPQKKFQKELLSVEDIRLSLEAIKVLARSVNPGLKLIFSVSPIRHLKDGFIENGQSKAHLLAAVHQLIDPKEKTYYFPAYEILMDELRDYRFYTADMLHPNQTAIDYVWEKFNAVWISEPAQKTMLQVAQVQKGLAHRPFDPGAKAYLEFLNNLNQQQEQLQQAFPHMIFK